MTEPIKISHDGPENFTLRVPSVEDVERMYEPPAAAFCAGSDSSKEIVGVGTAVYEGVPGGKAYDSHRKLIAHLAWDVGPNNLWIMHTMPRMAYPFSILYSIAGLFKTERVAGKKADWFFWHDDDVILPADTVRRLRKSANPTERPFVAACGYDRNYPFKAAVWQSIDDQPGVSAHHQWPDQKAGGLHKVTTTGLCAALFHRSFFDRVPQPWFVTVPPFVEPGGDLSCRIATDGWLSQQCHDYGVPIYVDCDVTISHRSDNMNINSATAPIYREAVEKMRAFIGKDQQHDR